MDERLKKAIEISHLSTVMSNQKRLLVEKFCSGIKFYKNGGDFTVTPELINFTQNILNRGKESVILIDSKNVPIKIENLEEFVDDIYDVYFNETNSYYNEYQQLTKSRSIQSIIDE